MQSWIESNLIDIIIMTGHSKTRVISFSIVCEGVSNISSEYFHVCFFLSLLWWIRVKSLIINNHMFGTTFLAQVTWLVGVTGRNLTKVTSGLVIAYHVLGLMKPIASDSPWNGGLTPWGFWNQGVQCRRREQQARRGNQIWLCKEEVFCDHKQAERGGSGWPVGWGWNSSSEWWVMKDVSESNITLIWRPTQISFSSRAGVRSGPCPNSDVSLEQWSSVCWCNWWSDCWSRSERAKPQVEQVACVHTERPSSGKDAMCLVQNVVPGFQYSAGHTVIV